jgi:hypothetical protein
MFSNREREQAAQLCDLMASNMDATDGEFPALFEACEEVGADFFAPAAALAHAAVVAVMKASWLATGTGYGLFEHNENRDDRREAWAEAAGMIRRDSWLPGDPAEERDYEGPGPRGFETVERALGAPHDRFDTSDVAENVPEPGHDFGSDLDEVSDAIEDDAQTAMAEDLAAEAATPADTVEQLAADQASDAKADGAAEVEAASWPTHRMDPDEEPEEDDPEDDADEDEDDEGPRELDFDDPHFDDEDES